MMRNVTAGACVLAVLYCAVFFSGCGSKIQLYGKPVTEKNTALIGDIFSHPGQFDGKMVRIDGKIMEECPSGCWFMLKDATGTIYVNIYPSNFVIPQASGRQAVVAGMVKKEGLKVSLIGSGVEIK